MALKKTDIEYAADELEWQNTEHNRQRAIKVLRIMAAAMNDRSEIPDPALSRIAK